MLLLEWATNILKQIFYVDSGRMTFEINWMLMKKQSFQQEIHLSEIKPTNFTLQFANYLPK